MTSDQLTTLFQNIDDNFHDALVSNNVHEIAKHLAEDWTLLEGQFGIVSKEQFLHVIELGDLSHTAMRKKVLQVKHHDKIAIVTSRGMNVGSFKGEPFNSEQWITNIYKKEDESWRCLMTQEAPVICSPVPGSF